MLLVELVALEAEVEGEVLAGTETLVLAPDVVVRVGKKGIPKELEDA
jgi:hypothetical protein